METNNEKLNWIDELTYGELVNIIGHKNINLLSLPIDLESKIEKDDVLKLKILLQDTFKQIIVSKRKNNTHDSILNGDLKDEFKIFIEAKSPSDEFYKSEKKEEKIKTPEEIEKTNKEMRSLGLFSKPKNKTDLDDIESLFD